MKHRELNRQLQAIDSLFKRTRAACGDDIEMMAHWARYLCVLCAGFLENALTALYSDYCRRSSNEYVASFATRTLELISNPKTGRFLEVAGKFRQSWREDLETFVDEDGRRDAIDSIMNNRHQIAHGQRSDITMARITTYFEKAVQVVDHIEDQCR
jgi:hypothetical protein